MRINPIRPEYHKAQMYLLVLIIGHSCVRERWNIGILIRTFQCVFDYAPKGQDVSKWATWGTASGEYALEFTTLQQSSDITIVCKDGRATLDTGLDNRLCDHCSWLKFIVTSVPATLSPELMQLGHTQLSAGKGNGRGCVLTVDILATSLDIIQKGGLNCTTFFQRVGHFSEPPAMSLKALSSQPLTLRFQIMYLITKSLWTKTMHTSSSFFSFC